MLKTGLVSRYGSDQFVCMTCDDCDLSLENSDKDRRRNRRACTCSQSYGQNMEFIRILINLYLFL